MNPEISKIIGIVKQAVKDYSEGKGSLTRNLATLCKEANFNNHEVNRAVEWANTLTQLQLFKSSSDRTVEFELADPREVSKEIFPEESEEVFKEASYLKYPDLITYLEKSSSVSKTPTKLKMSDYPVSSNELMKKAMACVDSLDRQKSFAVDEQLLATTRFQDKLYKIASNLGRLYSEDFTDFEQSSRDHLGDKCLPYLSVIQKMASSNNKRLLNYTPKKVIKSSENTTLLKEAIANSQLAALYKEAASIADKAVTNCKSRIDEYVREKLTRNV